MRTDLKFYKYHKNYSIYKSEQEWLNCYSDGEIASLQMIHGKLDPKTYQWSPSKITVQYRNGETYQWETLYINSYNMGQFGIAVTDDGKMVFAQTWENGLFCFDAKTGARIWRTKSRRGITNIFVGDHTVTAQLHDYAMQLIDIKTGEVLKEKRPCTAWGFTTLDHRHIVCHVTAHKWEIMEAETLAVKETFTHKEFTGNHADFCINHISLCGNGNIRVAGFQNIWDESEKPPKMLPNPEFEYFLKSKYFEELHHNILKSRTAADWVLNQKLCPVCGQTEFQEERNYDICENCGWENDGHLEEGGANTLSLTEYRKRYQIYRYLNPNYVWKIYGCPDLTTQDYCTYWHQYSVSNQENVFSSNRCGCFFCQKIFDGNLVSEHYINDQNGKTAICPLCGVDAILPDNKVDLSTKLLEDMHKVWFC